MIDASLLAELKRNKIIVASPATTQIATPNSFGMVFEPNIQLRQGLYDAEFIGSYTFIGGGPNTSIRGIKKIGRYCSIGANVTVGAVVHPDNFISTSTVFSGMGASAVWPDLKKFQEANADNLKVAAQTYSKDMQTRKGKITIGNDVWIGEGAYISRGVTIGDGAIIGARAVVIHDVPPYAIVGGVPAKIIRYRFDEPTIERLLGLRWWAYDLEVMKGVAFNEPERALDQIEENIAHGAAIYAPTAFKMYDTGINTVLSANYPQISDGRFLKVVRKIGDYHLTLDADNHHERDYYLAEKNNKLAVDALVAERFIQPGDCVLDAGANIGYTSLRYLASGAGQVHAFEPVEYVYSRLAEVASDRLHVYPLALSNENVTGSMIVSTKHRQGSTLKQSMIDRFPDVFGEQHVEQAVKVVRLDDELPNVEFDFMKLDVEGAEADCLRGAVNHLLSPRLRMVQVELYDSYFAEVDDILTHYFSYIYRIAVKISSNELVLLALDVPEAETEGLRIQPPMYLYSRDELV